MAVKLESSLTDLMTSLAVVFILLMVAMINNVGQAGKSDITKIQELLKNNQIDCIIRADDPLACTITVSEDRLKFDTNKSEIKKDGGDYLKAEFPKIMKVLMEKDRKSNISGVFIEGYTDTDGDDNVNLKLSQDRSLSVGQYLLNNVFNIDNYNYTEEKVNEVPSLFKILLTNFDYNNALLQWLYLNGRGEQNPIIIIEKHSSKLIPQVDNIDFFSSEVTDEKKKELENQKKEKELSRRVEITIKVKSFSQKINQSNKKASVS
jgi:OmpA family